MKNNIGLQTAYWGGTEPKLDIHQIIQYTKKANMKTIELKAGDFVPLTPEGRQELRREIEDAGLEITVNGTGLRAHKDVSSSDPEIREAGVAQLCHMIDLCVEMGVKYFSGIPYGVWNAKPDGDNVAEIKAERTKNAIASLKKVAAYAQEKDVLLCLEIVNRFEQYTINTVEEGIAMCKAIDNPYCKLLVDTFHMCIEEDNIAEAIRNAQEAGYLGYIHLGESNRKIPTGKKKTTIDWEEIADTINEIGFEGPMVMEPFVLDKSPSAKSVSLWRPLKDGADINGLVADAAAGVAYLASL